MEGAKLLIKELRIDWESLLTEEYNPLKQALENKKSSLKHSNYRNIYHKVEKVMEKIIEQTYKGFSDSVLSYMESYNLTSSCKNSISEILKILERMAETSINVDDIYKNYRDTEYMKMKTEICKDLCEIKYLYDEYKKSIKNEDFLKGARQLQNIRDLVKEKNLFRIEGIQMFMYELDNDIREFCDVIFGKLIKFIFYDCIENKEIFNTVIILNRIIKFDKFLISRFEMEIYSCIENIIFDVNQINDVPKDFNIQDVKIDDNREVELNEPLDNNNSIIFKNNIETLIFECLRREVNVKKFNNQKTNNINFYCFQKKRLHLNRSREKLVDYKKKILTKKISEKMERIRYNMNSMIELSFNSFSNLDEKSKNYYGEYEGLQIFFSDGMEKINSIIKKIILKFISVYAEQETENIEIEEFESINIVEDISYETEFENKYPIYQRIVNNKIIQEEKKDDFTLIFTPDVDMCIYLYAHIKYDEIKDKCMKYIEHKEGEILKKIIIIFQSKRWSRKDYATKRLGFLDDYNKIMKSVDNVISVFGTRILKRSAKLIYENILEKYKSYFVSKMIDEFVSLQKQRHSVIVVTDNIYSQSEIKFNELVDIRKFIDQGSIIKFEYNEDFKLIFKLEYDIIEHIKNTVINSSIDIGELIGLGSLHDDILFTINSLIDINNDESILNLIYMYCTSYKVSIILEVMFYFDIFYREGIYSNNTYLNKISRIIERVYKNLDVSEILMILDFYIVENIERLNVRSREDLDNFICKIKLLDEILGDVTVENNLNDSIVFLEKLMDLEIKDEQFEKIRKKKFCK